MGHLSATPRIIKKKKKKGKREGYPIIFILPDRKETTEGERDGEEGKMWPTRSLSTTAGGRPSSLKSNADFPSEKSESGCCGTRPWGGGGGGVAKRPRKKKEKKEKQRALKPLKQNQDSPKKGTRQKQ